MLINDHIYIDHHAGIAMQAVRDKIRAFQQWKEEQVENEEEGGSERDEGLTRKRRIEG